jgi:hypothetical protein
MKLLMLGVIGVGGVAGQLITSINTLAPGTTVCCVGDCPLIVYRL